MSEKLRTLSKDVKKLGVKIKRIKVELTVWLIKYSLDVSKGRVQRSVAIFITSGMKNPPKNFEFSQVLPRFQAVPLLFLRNSYLLKHLITLFVIQPIYRGYGNKGYGQGKPG